MASEAALDRIDAGQRALDAGDWERARALFRAALDEEELPEAWEGLGWAGWWLNLGEPTIAAREAAFRLHRARGDRVGAGRVAAWLAADHREYRGDEAVGAGWLVRAAAPRRAARAPRARLADAHPGLVRARPRRRRGGGPARAGGVRHRPPPGGRRPRGRRPGPGGRGPGRPRRGRGGDAAARRGVGDRPRRGPPRADLDGVGALLPHRRLRGGRRLPARGAVVRGDADARGALARAPGARHVPDRVRADPRHARRLARRRDRAVRGGGRLRRRRARDERDVARAPPASCGGCRAASRRRASSTSGPGRTRTRSSRSGSWRSRRATRSSRGRRPSGSCGGCRSAASSTACRRSSCAPGR